MRFFKRTDCKLSVSNGSVNVLSTHKTKSILLLMLDIAADSSSYLQLNDFNFSVG